MGNLNIVSAKSLQHQAILPRSVAFNSHRLAGILLQEKAELTFAFRHLSNAIEQGNRAMCLILCYVFYFSSLLPPLLSLVGIFIPTILDFPAPCLPTEGGIFALFSLPSALRWSQYSQPVIRGMTEMKPLRQGHIPFHLQTSRDIPALLTVTGACLSLYEAQPGLQCHPSALIALMPVSRQFCVACKRDGFLEHLLALHQKVE